MVRPTQVLVPPKQFSRGRPAVLTEIKTTPAPHPLPRTWLRALANSITITFREHGWQKHEKRRVHHPTGNPRSNPRPTSSVHRSALLTNTETLEIGRAHV